jgi:hypothetical protein
VRDTAFVLGVLSTNHVRDNVNLEAEYSGRGGLATLTAYSVRSTKHTGHEDRSCLDAANLLKRGRNRALPRNFISKPLQIREGFPRIVESKSGGRGGG